MDIRPLSNEEIDTIRAVYPWMKVLGGGSFLAFVVALWKAFGLYKRLSDLEEEVKEMRVSESLTITRHEELTEVCQLKVESKIKAATDEMHDRLIGEIQKIQREMMTFRETQCNILGELKQLNKSLKSE